MRFTNNKRDIKFINDIQKVKNSLKHIKTLLQIFKQKPFKERTRIRKLYIELYKQFHNIIYNLQKYHSTIYINLLKKKLYLLYSYIIPFIELIKGYINILSVAI